MQGGAIIVSIMEGERGMLRTGSETAVWRRAGTGPEKTTSGAVVSARIEKAGKQ